MNATITIRIDELQREILNKKARLIGKSASAFIREILDRELDEVPLGKKAGHLRGILSLAEIKKSPFRTVIRNHNWRR